MQLRKEKVGDEKKKNKTAKHKRVKLVLNWEGNLDDKKMIKATLFRLLSKLGNKMNIFQLVSKIEHTTWHRKGKEKDSFHNLPHVQTISTISSPFQFFLINKMRDARANHETNILFYFLGWGWGVLGGPLASQASFLIFFKITAKVLTLVFSIKGGTTCRWSNSGLAKPIYINIFCILWTMSIIIIISQNCIIFTWVLQSPTFLKVYSLIWQVLHSRLPI